MAMMDVLVLAGIAALGVAAVGMVLYAGVRCADLPRQLRMARMEEQAREYDLQNWQAVVERTRLEVRMGRRELDLADPQDEDGAPKEL